MTRLAFASALLFSLASSLVAAPPDFDRTFDSTVAPVLAGFCLDCHSGPKPKGDLDLTRAKGFDAAEVWKRIAAGEMPPKKPLPEAQKKVVRDWIDRGAKWGTDPIDPFRITTSARAGYDWWSLQPVARPAVPPKVSAIDHFVEAARKAKGLTASPPAEKRTLIRRAYFDLIGLPPTPEEVAEFEADASPGAWSKVVERLLASPHYGERWARHWLDVVRFGETDGFERNTPRPAAWHYRDWVIRALNADMPYDAFVRRQIAGDILEPDDADAVRATGFLVAGVHNTVNGSDEMRTVARQDELEDLVGAVGQTFLGLTVNCARCHDHKFDPIAQTDFYRLSSALDGVDFGERPLPDPKVAADIARATARVAEFQSALGQIDEPIRREMGAESPSRTGPTPVASWDFRKGTEDSVGLLHARVAGGAKASSEGLKFDGKTGLARTQPLEIDLGAKTLEAWVKLGSLGQRGGGVLSVQTLDASAFDGIVFGELEPGRWMAGSDGFGRTRSFAGNPETEAADRPVHLAVTWAADGTIAAYRDGRPYGKAYRSAGLRTYRAGQTMVVFGCRHEPAGGNKMLAGTLSVANLYDRALTPSEVAASFARGPNGGNAVGDEAIELAMEPEVRAARKQLQLGKARAETRLALLMSLPPTRAYAVVPRTAGATRLLNRGQANEPGRVIAPAGVASVRSPSSDFGLAADAPDAARRVRLAEWITSSTNPLFARVMVNRVWHYHFGTGLVETPSDFGFNGGRPSHPELLDWLAAEFVRPSDLSAKPFSVKHVHRLILASATFRQSSAPDAKALEIDADDRLLWRYRPHRLEAEAIRDSMLAVSGLLNREVGGEGFSDYRVRDYGGTAYFEPTDATGSQNRRRSVYRFVPRGGNAGLLDAFDCPDSASAAPRRGSTTTPIQALSLWNNSFSLRMADALAERVGDGPADEKVRRVWKLAYQRDPTTDELAGATKLATQRGMKALCRALLNSNEFVAVE